MSGSKGDLTHFDEAGRARMVDVSAKDETVRIAVARGEIHMRSETIARIQAGKIKKGDVLAVADVAAVMGAKRTPDMIPMCHTLLLSGVNIEFEERREPATDGRSILDVQVRVKCTGSTGVEMEALTAVSTALLTVYDMCKAIDRDMTLTGIELLEKEGGKSGHYIRGKS
ncbi:MAG: cyclic pyranopterin monophosphate synthase MoaC [Mariprofundaceae bacterium]|nr:cyclic pyranopterin monophosphate synthase MoaC [Mariprofundaceae bacterium]